MFLERLENTHFCSTSFRPWFFFPPQYWRHRFRWVSKCCWPTPWFLPISLFIFSISFALHLDGDCSREIKRHLFLGRKAMTNLDSILRSKDIYFAIKGPSSQGYGFSSGHVWMWELDHKEVWAPKNWCFWTVVLEKTLESPLDRKEIKPVNPKGNQPWIFTERTDAEAEAPRLWSLNLNSGFIRKHPDAGKGWRQRRRGQQRIRCLDGIINSADMSLSKL